MGKIKAFNREDFATSTGDEICKDICKKTTIYRYLTYLLPLIGIPVGITIGNGVSNQLTGTSNVSSNVLSAIAAVTMSKIAVRVAKKYSEKQIKRIIGLEDHEDDGLLNFDICKEDKFGDKKIIGIKAEDILNLAIIAGSDHELLKEMIIQFVEYKASQEEPYESKISNFSTKVDSIKRDSLNKIKKKIKKIDISRINSFLSSVIVKLLPIPGISRFAIKKIYIKFFEKISNNTIDKKDGKKDGMIDGLPIDVHILLKNIAGDNAEIYNSLKEIYNERQEELKPDIEDLDEIFKGKTIGQKLANKLKQNNLLMKIWFIKNFVIKQALALPPANYNRFGERVRFKDEISQNGELKEIDKHNQKQVILTSDGKIVRVSPKDR